MRQPGHKPGRKEDNMQRKQYDIKVKGDVADVYSPYNPEFVRRVKALGGQWEREERCWTIRAESIDAVRAAMDEVYGRSDLEPGKTVTVVATFDRDDSAALSGYMLFGQTIAVARDRDSGARVGDNAAFLRGEPKSGGSRSNWYTLIPAGSEVEIYKVPADYAAKCMDNLPEGVTARIKDEGPNYAALAAERDRLMARIAEIDRLLAGK